MGFFLGGRRESTLRLNELRLENLRRFEQLELQIEPGWNAFVGPNGAGKTTILEAAFMLSHGHSFRAGGKVGVQRDGSVGYSVFGKLANLAGESQRIGIARLDGRLVGRVDGETVGVGELVRQCAVVCFEPGSHDLIAGPAEVRRQFLDWGVFHVEPTFLSGWRRYHRALKQRNVLLRQAASNLEFEPWEIEAADAGEGLTAARELYVEQIRPHLEQFTNRLIPELGQTRLSLNRGWDGDISLRETLVSRRSVDRDRGHTTRGPHRADWAVTFEHSVRREHYSRGQEKLVALACLLAQAQLHAHIRGHWPLLCLDDVASELDAVHQQAVIEAVGAADAQVLVTGTTQPDGLRGATFPVATFHVEHGQVRRLV